MHREEDIRSQSIHDTVNTPDEPSPISKSNVYLPSRFSDPSDSPPPTTGSESTVRPSVTDISEAEIEETARQNPSGAAQEVNVEDRSADVRKSTRSTKRRAGAHHMMGIMESLAHCVCGEKVAVEERENEARCSQKGCETQWVSQYHCHVEYGTKEVHSVPFKMH